MGNDVLNISEKEFLEFFNSKTFDESMFNVDGSLNKNYNSFKKTGIIASIFEDNWDVFYSANKDLVDKFRPNANKEIHKIIDCHNKDLGCSLYECPSCHDFVFIGHTCKSRLCSSCGYNYKNYRVESILQTAYNCKHRQIVFTIPKELRPFFFFPFQQRIDILFEAVSKTIYSIANSTFKKTKKNGKIEYISKTNFTPRFLLFSSYFW